VPGHLLHPSGRDPRTAFIASHSNVDEDLPAPSMKLAFAAEEPSYSPQAKKL
jgi:hypothetical protein